MQFMERVDELTKEKGLTGKQVMEQCGISKNSFVNWRSGRKPTKTTKKILAEFFGVSVEYLMGETDDRTQKSSPGQVTEAEVDADLVNIWEDANEEDRKLLLDMARMVRDRRNGNAK